MRRRAIITLAPALFAGCQTTRSLSTQHGDAEGSMSWDVFVTAGQSNATGTGVAGESPDITPRTGYEYDSNAVKHLNDPVGRATDGSAWPAFHREFYGQTGGREAIYVTTTESASSVAPETGDTGDDSWASGETLRGRSVDETNAAKSFLNDIGRSFTLRGVLWCQGERDAQFIDDSTITKSDYKTATKGLFSYFRTEHRSDLPVFIFQTGHLDSGDTAGFQDVRDAQSEIVSEQSNTYMVSTIQKDFPEEGKMADEYHYTQTGYNEMGRTGAKSVADVATGWSAQ